MTQTIFQLRVPRFDTGVGARQAAGDRGNTDDTVIRRRKAAGAGRRVRQNNNCRGAKVGRCR